MRRGRKSRSAEINLAPLLDVLFTILFIVLLASAQTEADLQAEKEQSIAEMQQQVDAMGEDLADTQQRLESMELYHREAVVLTLANTTDGATLAVSEGSQALEDHGIALRDNSTERLQRSLTDLIGRYLENTDNQPIYIVFSVDREHIRTAQYKAIVSTLDQLQLNYKEIFWKLANTTDETGRP